MAIGTVKGILTQQNVNVNDVVRSLPDQEVIKNSHDLIISEFRDRINLIRGQAQALSARGQGPASQGDKTATKPKAKSSGKTTSGQQTETGGDLSLGQNDSTVKELKGEIEKIEKEARSLFSAA